MMVCGIEKGRKGHRGRERGGRAEGDTSDVLLVGRGCLLRDGLRGRSGCGGRGLGRRKRSEEERERAAQVAAAVAWTEKGMEEDGGEWLLLLLPGREKGFSSGGWRRGKASRSRW
jgi:hypothetical protein